MLHHALGEAILLGDTVKQISLSQGHFAIVDDEDFEYLNQFKWFAHYRGGRFYAMRRRPILQGIGKIHMHRVIMNAPENMVVDHINNNSLDNRRSNLRLCSQTENMHNRKKHRTNTTGYIGVSRETSCNRWRACLRIDDKTHHLGLFRSPEEAARAYDRAVIQYRDEFASLNFPRSDYE